MISFINYLCSLWNDFFYKEDGIQTMYLVNKDGTKIEITVEELFKPHDHIEIHYIRNNKNYVHIVPFFHKIHEPPIILSAILNKNIDITDHVNQYLMNDLTYLKVKHIIPQKYLNTFDTLEILDEDCNSLIYRKLESRLEFLEPFNYSRERSNSCSDIYS